MASNETSGVTTGQPNLHKQDLSKLNVRTLTPLSPEVISRQATINIGTIGHVAHGKSTVVKAISGVQTVRFKNELERNITIKLERVDSLFSIGPDGTVFLPKTNLQPSSRPSRSSKRRRTSVESCTSSTVSSDVSSMYSRPRGLKRRVSLPTNVSNKPIYALEYVVEKILAHKVVNKKQMFLVKWKDWPQETNTWEPLENLSNCPQPLEDFLAESLEKPVIMDLQLWLKMESIGKSELEKFIPTAGFSGLPNKITVQRDLLKLTTIPLENRTPKMFDFGTRTMYLYLILMEREKQLNKLKDWENEMNATSAENANLTVENFVDLEGPPNGFIYVNEYIPSNDIIIPDDPPIGCECDDDCGPRKKDCCFTQNYFSYNVKGRITVGQGTPVYECNKRCRCEITCRNRVVQLGRKIPLCIFRTSSGCGWGVKTLKKIPIGQFVCEYVGEIISFEEAEKRGKGYDAEGRTYLFDLDFNSDNDFPYTVDAATYGNVSHFINHSCSPNLGVWAVWVNCLDPNIPKIALFALREIQKGEELTFDYMCGSTQEKQSPQSPSRNRLTLPDDNGSSLQNCKCGADSCRRYLF